MASGDLGWVGLAVKMSEVLMQQDYVVVGFNVREYLSSFTAGTQHVSIDDIRADYRAMSELLADEGLLRRPGTAVGRIGRGGPGGGGRRGSPKPHLG